MNNLLHYGFILLGVLTMAIALYIHNERNKQLPAKNKKRWIYAKGK